MEFPFELVFDYFAKPLDGKVVPEHGWPPALYLVFLAGGAVDHVEPLPVAHLFGSNQGKAQLGAGIRRVLADLPATACLVLTSEAWQKTVQVVPGAPPRDRTHSLEGDPEAQDILTFQLYHHTGQQTGALPIGPGRVVAYRPLDMNLTSAGGRLSLRPDANPEQEVQDAQSMAAAAVKRAAGKV
jgi:hypothetical protein